MHLGEVRRDPYAPFLFKHKSAYEILACLEFRRVLLRSLPVARRGPHVPADRRTARGHARPVDRVQRSAAHDPGEIGRASCRERLQSSGCATSQGKKNMRRYATRLFRTSTTTYL